MLTRTVPLNAPMSGVIGGVVAGLGIFIVTNWLVFEGGDAGGSRALPGQFLVGYDVTLVGSFVGSAYGFLFGFCTVYFVAVLCNGLVDLRERRRQSHL